MIEDYTQAKKLGEAAVKAAAKNGESPFLPVLEEEEGITTCTNDKVIDPKRIMCTGEEETSICLNYSANLKTASTLRKMSLKTHLKKKTTQRNVDQINS